MRAFILLCLIALPSPIPRYRVLDEAGVLSEGAKSHLEALSREIDVATTAEIAVVTVNTLDGLSVENYANQLFNKWGIGKRGVNNGVLLLVAPNERRIRIEVGYGLEPLLTDGRCGDIIAGSAIPAFKRGEFEKGIVSSADEIAKILREYPEPARGIAGSAPRFMITKRDIAALSVYGPSSLAVVCLLLSIFVARRRYFPAGLFAVIMGSLCLVPTFALWYSWDRVTPFEIGGVAGLSVIALFVATNRFLRYGIHICSKCRGSMSLLSEIEDDKHLDAVQKIEEKLGTVDYDVWVCPACLTKDTASYVEWISSVRKCPRCRHRTFQEVTVTIVVPTYHSTGTGRVDGDCCACKYHTSCDVTIPAQQYTSSSHGGFSSGGCSSGGGGSFGGGSSGGGGASGSW